MYRPRYVYKTKQYKRDQLQTNIFIKQKFTDKLCLQNKTKVYKHVMFTKQKTKQSLQTRYVYKAKSLHTSYVYKTKQFL